MVFYTSVYLRNTHTTYIIYSKAVFYIKLSKNNFIILCTSNYISLNVLRVCFEQSFSYAGFFVGWEPFFFEFFYCSLFSFIRLKTFFLASKEFAAVAWILFRLCVHSNFTILMVFQYYLIWLFFLVKAAHAFLASSLLRLFTDILFTLD